jgi:hypothetical protein
MSSDLAMTMMSAAECILSAMLAFMFWKKGLHRRFPAMGVYLAMRVVFNPIQSLLLLGRSGHLVASRSFQITCAQAYLFV